jgi:hypothetical protein
MNRDATRAKLGATVSMMAKQATLGAPLNQVSKARSGDSTVEVDLISKVLAPGINQT